MAPLRAARSGFRLRPIFFDLIYNSTGEIHIAAENEPQPKTTSRAVYACPKPIIHDPNTAEKKSQIRKNILFG